MQPDEIEPVRKELLRLEEEMTQYTKLREVIIGSTMPDKLKSNLAEFMDYLIYLANPVQREHPIIKEGTFMVVVRFLSLLSAWIKAEIKTNIPETANISILKEKSVRIKWDINNNLHMIVEFEPGGHKISYSIKYHDDYSHKGPFETILFNEKEAYKADFKKFFYLVSLPTIEQMC